MAVIKSHSRVRGDLLVSRSNTLESEEFSLASSRSCRTLPMAPFLHERSNDGSVHTISRRVVDELIHKLEEAATQITWRATKKVSFAPDQYSHTAHKKKQKKIQKQKESKFSHKMKRMFTGF
jgi:hypothetical protein